jgi:DNA-binding MarR family transcriptional regulator
MWAMSKKNERDAEEIDTIIHEPSRLKIMAQLYVVKEADFTFLKNQLDLTWGNISSHVTKLEAAGYVEVTKEFVEKKPRTTLRLTDTGRSAFETYRRKIQALIDGPTK